MGIWLLTKKKLNIQGNTIATKSNWLSDLKEMSFNKLNIAILNYTYAARKTHLAVLSGY